VTDPDERARRISLNEALFRQVNEQLEDLADTFRPGSDQLELICECGNLACEEQIRLDRNEYEALRRDALFFAVVHGHELPDVEEIVERHPTYDVVRKREPEAQRVAELTDPRSG
jgi:hypothetical protein